MYAHTWHVTFTRWVFFFEFHVIFFSPFPIQLFYTCLVSCNSFIFSDSFFFLYDYSIFTWSIYSYKLFFVKLTWFVHFHVIKKKTKKNKTIHSFIFKWFIEFHLFTHDSFFTRCIIHRFLHYWFMSTCITHNSFNFTRDFILFFFTRDSLIIPWSIFIFMIRFSRFIHHYDSFIITIHLLLRFIRYYDSFIITIHLSSHFIFMRCS